MKLLEVEGGHVPHSWRRHCNPLASLRVGNCRCHINVTDFIPDINLTELRALSLITEFYYIQ